MGRKIQKVSRSLKELLLLKQLRNNTRRCRKNKNRKKSICKHQLRPVSRMTNVCNLVSNKLEELLPLSTEDRIIKTNEMF